MPLAKLFFKRRHGIEKIGHQPVIGNLENRRFIILVDGDNHLTVFHAGKMLNGPGNANRNIKVRRDDLAGLANLIIIGNETGIYRSA